MIRFLFWNVCGVASTRERSRGRPRPLLPGDARYLRLRRVLQLLAAGRDGAGHDGLDVIVLAESPFEGLLGLTSFAEAKTTLRPNRTTGTRLEVYHRNTIAARGFEVAGRAVLQELTVTATGQELLLVCAHLDSGLRKSEKERREGVNVLAADIRDRERRLGHRRTLLVGDLNYDPYDEAVTDAYGLNAVASRAVMRQSERRIHRREPVPYFYNPMWAHLSDVVGNVAGTYYRKTNAMDCRFWYTPDQVMLRPELIAHWRDLDLRILSAVGKAGKIVLLNRRGQPDRERFSDHLPITFALRDL